MKCFFCTKPVDLDDEETFREVKSWVNGPKLDGPVLREQTGAVAHPECIRLIIHGQDPNQEGLFEVEKEEKGDWRSSTCEAQAVKGTGTGICGTPLTMMGDCVNGDNHVF